MSSGAHLAALVRSRTRLQTPPLVPELRLHLAEDITAAWQHVEAELGRGALDPPYWAFAWVGGQALARYLLDTPEVVRGRRVLDLATGSGLLALAARLAGATDVLAVDTDPLAVAAVAENAAANGLAVRARCVDLTGGPVPDADVLLAGDVCYDREMTDLVLPFLRRAAAAGLEVLLGDPGRHYLPRAGLTPLAEYAVPTTRELEGTVLKRVRVHRVEAAPAAEREQPDARRR